eukprot:UC1_evm2s2032
MAFNLYLRVPGAIVTVIGISGLELGSFCMSVGFLSRDTPYAVAGARLSFWVCTLSHIYSVFYMPTHWYLIYRARAEPFVARSLKSGAMWGYVIFSGVLFSVLIPMRHAHTSKRLDQAIAMAASTAQDNPLPVII